MSKSHVSLFRRLWPWLRWPFWLGLGFSIGLLGPYVYLLDQRVQSRFGDLEFSQPTRVYARPVALAPALPMNARTLIQELKFADYQRVPYAAYEPGTWSQNQAASSFVIASRGYRDPLGGELPRRVRVKLGAKQVLSLTDLTAQRSLLRWHLDPARIATLYGAAQEERQIVALQQVPTLLVTGLQAVEDRDFKHHIGIDFKGIARALYVDLRSGRMAQGGSTLTQQLVRNLFLDNSRTLVRKLNEALISILITAHYSKGRILDAYINEVFLGQQGGQAVHGFAAASKFYFGRPLQTLRPQAIAMLVGMVRGPSYYNPRRYPSRTLARRNAVLRIFNQTGLISSSVMARAMSAPLGVNPNARLPRDRFPDFMDLVRRQLHEEFNSQRLRGGGLAVYTTLDPAAQLDAERALSNTLYGFGSRGRGLQGAVVVTNAHSGEVLALVGSRNPSEVGFNRALDARRQIGSTIKPFVYLIALAQPSRWSLASILNDAPVTWHQPDGTIWSPQNDDHISHGKVLLVDALAHSYNQATVQLGFALGVRRVQQLLESFGLKNVNPNPSLLLGAEDLSPFQLAHMYQFLASGGRAEPLTAVRGVLDAHGKLLLRYTVKPGKGEYRSAIHLLTWALQQVTTYGTAAALSRSSLAALHVAGKTGTSEGQRDTWFAGYTGEHLAVVWIGRDDNRPTHLWGASGALPVWMRLFSQLPTRALSVQPGPGLHLAWINPRTGHQTPQSCQGARRIPFIQGYLPKEEDHCYWQELKNLFKGASPATASSSLR